MTWLQVSAMQIPLRIIKTQAYVISAINDFCLRRASVFWIFHLSTQGSHSYTSQSVVPSMLFDWKRTWIIPGSSKLVYSSCLLSL